MHPTSTKSQTGREGAVATADKNVSNTSAQSNPVASTLKVTIKDQTNEEKRVFMPI